MAKQFKMDNPANTYMDAIATAQAVQDKPTKKARTVIKKKEARSKHASLLLTPTMFQQAKLIAQLEGTSFNDIVTNLLGGYIDDYCKDRRKAKQLQDAMALFTGKE